MAFCYLSCKCNHVGLLTCSILVTILFMGLADVYAAEQLIMSPSYYATTCPKALSTIKTVVANVVSKDQRMAASLLRLHFHDCFVNGCDASVLLDDTSSFTGEKSAGPNAGSLRGFEVIDTIKCQLEISCPGLVSCADILAVAARDAVALVGGPSWPVELGRRDSTTASLSDANNQIPSPLMDLKDLISAFSDKGFTEKEMVALAGSHTIGQARCFLFRNRIHNETNINAEFATSLQSNCSASLNDIDADQLAPLDTTTQFIFDNAYYNNLINNKGLLHSDQQLFSGGSTDSQVALYSKIPLIFYADFAKAMIKIANLTLLTGSNGQIRTNCRKVN